MTKKSFITGAIILMAAGFIVRILGFIYRIYLSNLIGAEGMGLFQLIMPLYSLIVLTLTSGISIAVSKMIASELARSHIVNVRRITKLALLVVFFAGIIVSVTLLIFSNFISATILKDSRTYYSLIIMVPCIPLIAAASAIKGYFYGIQQVTPTAISQIVEQIVRIAVVILMASYFVNISMQFACALATLGMAAGEIANLAILLFIYKYQKIKPLYTRSRFGFLRKRLILKDLFKISVPVSFNRFITSIMSAIEFILIPRRLISGGMSFHSSLAEYGRLTGMAMPLIFFPALVTSSLATTLVPAISEAISLKNFNSVNYRISKSIQLTFILGFIFTAIFLTFPREIGDLIYKKENIGPILYLLSFSCVFLYLQQTLLGVLNGLGKQSLSLRNSVIGYTIRIGFVYFIVPPYGLKGYVWGIIISSSIVCILNLMTVVRTTGMFLDLRNWIIKPGIVGIVMFFIGKYIYSFFDIFCSDQTIMTLLTILGCIIIGLMLMMVAGVLDRNEILRLFGRSSSKQNKVA